MGIVKKSPFDFLRGPPGRASRRLSRMGSRMKSHPLKSNGKSRMKSRGKHRRISRGKHTWSKMVPASYVEVNGTYKGAVKVKLYPEDVYLDRGGQGI